MKLIHPVINRQGAIDTPWNAFLDDRSIGIYAHSRGAAMQKAIEYFRPKKAQRALIKLEPAEE